MIIVVTLVNGVEYTLASNPEQLDPQFEDWKNQVLREGVTLCNDGLPAWVNPAHIASIHQRPEEGPDEPAREPTDTA